MGSGERPPRRRLTVKEARRTPCAASLFHVRPGEHVFSLSLVDHHNSTSRITSFALRESLSCLKQA